MDIRKISEEELLCWSENIDAKFKKLVISKVGGGMSMLISNTSKECCVSLLILFGKHGW